MAERDFDAEVDHSQAEEHRFTLGGYRFRARAIAPPGAFLDASRGLNHAVRFLRRVVVPEDRAELERILEMSDSSAVLLDTAPDLLRAAALVLATEDMDNDEARAQAFKSLREVIEKIEQPQEPGPTVSATQIDDAAAWLMGETIGRPLASASPSSRGGGRTSNGSKATSRKPARASAN